MRSTSTTKAASTARGSSWTGGRQLGARMTGLLMWVAIACGPLALLGVAGGLGRPATVAAAAPSQQAGLTTAQQTAGEFALGYVTSWLGATQKTPGDLGVYVDLSALRGLSQQAWTYRDAGVVSVAPQTGSPFITVVVAASVQELQIDNSSDASTTAWVRRYFQVTISADSSGALRAVGLPVPVAAPAQASPVALGYQQTVASSDPAAQAITGFLGAYLSGSGDIARYTTPGVSISAITPAPYVKADVLELRTDTAPSAVPADGTVVHALATVSVLSPLDQQLTTTTALTLTARAGRWEISAIDLSPQQAPQKGEPTITPTPTGAG